MAIRILIILILGLADLTLFAKMVWGPSGIIAYRDLKNEYKSLQDRIEKLDKENMALSREIRLLNSDDKYVEKMVREKLRYLRDNEIVYLFPAGPVSQPGASQNDSKN